MGIGVRDYLLQSLPLRDDRSPDFSGSPKSTAHEGQKEVWHSHNLTITPELTLLHPDKLLN